MIAPPCFLLLVVMIKLHLTKRTTNWITIVMADTAEPAIIIKHWHSSKQCIIKFGKIIYLFGPCFLISFFALREKALNACVIENLKLSVARIFSLGCV